MAAVQIGRGSTVNLYVDQSPDSTKVREALEGAGVNYRLIQSSSFTTSVPAIETPYLRMEGYHRISRYFLSEK